MELLRNEFNILDGAGGEIMNKEVVVLIVAAVVAVALWIGCIIQFVKELKEGRNKE